MSTDYVIHRDASGRVTRRTVAVDGGEPRDLLLHEISRFEDPDAAAFHAAAWKKALDPNSPINREIAADKARAEREILADIARSMAENNRDRL